MRPPAESALQQRHQLVGKLVDVSDLFDLLPDLPWPRRRPLQQRLDDVRRRADAVRAQFRTATERQKVNARRAQDAWKRKIGRG
jgi:hypothetical protein